MLRYYIGDSYLDNGVNDGLGGGILGGGGKKKNKKGGGEFGLGALGLSALHEDEDDIAMIINAMDADTQASVDFFGEELEKAHALQDEDALFGAEYAPHKSKFRWAQPGAGSTSGSAGVGSKSKVSVSSAGSAGVGSKGSLLCGGD